MTGKGKGSGSAKPRAVPKRRAEKEKKKTTTPPKKDKSGKKNNSKKRRTRTLGAGSTVFNPLNNAVPPTLYGDKGVFKMGGTVRSLVEQTLGKRYMMFCTAIPGSGTIGCYLRWTAGSAAVADGFTAYTIPLLATSGSAGGPTASRVTKVGVRMVNTTANLYLGGQVTVSHIAQRLKLPAGPNVMTGAQWDSVFNVIRGLPISGPTRTVPYSFADFGPGGRQQNRVFHAVVSDEVKYAEYNNHEGTVADINDFFDNLAIWSGSVEEPRPMTTIVFAWDTPTDAVAALQLQQLTFNFDGQLLTRWPLDTVPGISAKDEPGKDFKEVERSRRDHAGSH